MKTFMPTEPCKRGHMSERYINGNSCKQCVRENAYTGDKRREYYKEYHKRPDRAEARRKRYLKYKAWYFLNNKKSLLRVKYGITLEEYKEIFDKQKGVCALCLREEKGKMLAVDHCHITGKVRGLLCGNCNRALGLFQDNPDILERAKEYVL